jgi:dTDP-4-dehydrorhamnose reductase
VRILIAGGSGYLGTELARQAAADGHEVIATYRSAPAALTGVRWRQLDVRRRDDVRALIDATSPDVVLNAAYQYDDWDTTATGAGFVAAAAEHAGAHLVHVSSDALFSGAAASYPETARPDPVMPYGAAKAAAETAVQAVHPAATIARTSLITGDGRSPHEKLVHDLVAGRRAGALFTDDIRCPVHVADLAAALLELAALGRAGPHHVAGPDAVSRHELGCLIARRDGLDPAALPTATRAGQVAGPLAVRLDSRVTQALLRTRLRGAREFLGPADADSSNPGVGTAR